MKKIIIVLLVIFDFVSCFEVFHLTTEFYGWRTCGMVYDLSGKMIGADMTVQLKIVYKFFAFPVKTIWILVSQNGKYACVATGRGENQCDGNWKRYDFGGVFEK